MRHARAQQQEVALFAEEVLAVILEQELAVCNVEQLIVVNHAPSNGNAFIHDVIHSATNIRIDVTNIHIFPKKPRNVKFWTRIAIYIIV